MISVILVYRQIARMLVISVTKAAMNCINGIENIMNFLLGFLIVKRENLLRFTDCLIFGKN
jgi:hypothetical protein